MCAAPQTGVGKTVCVTGASGYIASHLVKQLLQRGYTVKATVRDASNEAKYGWIKSLAEGTSGSVELFSADLLDMGSFDKAVEGCEYVCHVAAVAAFNVKDPKREVVDPSLEGTRNVFGAIAKAQTAKRVVLTSSVAAITDDFQPKGRTYTEEDWHHELSLKSAYPMAKTLAEKFAWKACEEQKAKGGWAYDLVAINPALVLGEVLHDSQTKTSVQIILQMMDGTLPLAPDFYFSIVHVHDTALAHVLALETPQAQGRYILANETTQSMLDIARVIRTAYPQCKAPTMGLPTLFLYAVALLNPMLNMETVRRRAGAVSYFSNKKARTELGIEFTPPQQCILDTAKCLIDRGIVPAVAPGPQLPFDLSSFFAKKEDPKESTEAPAAAAAAAAAGAPAAGTPAAPSEGAAASGQEAAK